MMRAQSSDHDCQQMQIAQEKTAEAFKNTCKKIKASKTEFEVSGTLQGELLKRTPYGLSFNPIVASGKNAQILHYIHNNAPLEKNSLLLLDFGLKWGLQVSDCSRTLPVNGRFNPLQALLYTIVLDTQRLFFMPLRPVLA